MSPLASCGPGRNDGTTLLVRYFASEWEIVIATAMGMDIPEFEIRIQAGQKEKNK
jgi:hypothetical protein